MPRPEGGTPWAHYALTDVLENASRDSDDGRVVGDQLHEHVLGLHRSVHADGGRYIAINNFVAHLKLPLRKLARIRAPISGATVLIQFVDCSRRTIALDVFQDVPTAAIETSLKTLRDVKERIKTLAEPSGDVAAK